MTYTCLNPDCEREMPVVGVCVACANSTYKPSRDGMDIGSFVVAGTNA